MITCYASLYMHAAADAYSTCDMDPCKSRCSMIGAPGMYRWMHGSGETSEQTRTYQTSARSMKHIASVKSEGLMIWNRNSKMRLIGQVPVPIGRCLGDAIVCGTCRSKLPLQVPLLSPSSLA